MMENEREIEVRPPDNTKNTKKEFRLSSESGDQSR